MRLTPRLVLIVSMSLFAFGGCAKPDAGTTLNKLYDDYWQYRMERDPERALYLGDHRYDDRLHDYGAAALEEDKRRYREFADRLYRVDRNALTEADRLNADLFSHSLNDYFLAEPFPEHLMPIKQQESFQITLGLLQQYHRFDTPEDCARYAAQLRGVKKQVADMIGAMNDGIRQGVVRPRNTIEKALPQIEAFLVSDPAESLLAAPAKSLTGKAGGTSSREHIIDAARDAIAALTRLRDFLHDTYLPACRTTVGYGDLPDGQAWYRAMAKIHTTTDATPEEMHRLGLDELARIHREMEKIVREVGFTGTLREFIDKLRTDPAHHNKTPDEIMRRHAEILRRSDANLHKVFGVLPKIPYELKEIEPFRCQAAPEAYYYNAPDDGSRPAYFYVNVCEPTTRPIYTMEALAYHEAQPGHHFQLAIAQEKKGWPAFRRFESINAYIEGWALYSEVLGYDLGGYRDPYSRFGQLTYDTWRSSRLVVDTGMHAFGWSRDRAIDFMLANTALSRQNIESEVDRYIAWPGQALGYKMGQLEILRLRKQAEETLGPRFDLRAFHDHLLAEGSLPLSMLRRRMEDWITAQH